MHVGMDLGDGTIVHVEWGGKKRTSYSEWLDVIRLTPVTPLTDAQQASLRQLAMTLPVKGYSLGHALRSVLWTSSDDERTTGQRYHCAEFVSYLYRQIGIDLVPNRADDSTQPQHFLTSAQLHETEDTVCTRSAIRRKQ